MKKYKAILFDFDGVLGRTMEDNFEAWQHAFSRVGITIKKEEYFLLEGKSPEKIVEQFVDPSRSHPDLRKSLSSFKEDYYLKNNSFAFYEEVFPLLEDLDSKGFLLGLITGASRKRLLSSGAKILPEFFDVVITSDDCAESKPNPAPYRLAAETLGVVPSDCLVVENAPLGIEAAKRAGMSCIAITSTLESRYLKEADRIVGKLSDIRDFIL